jgi:Gpi18-like mannosyltransferase
MVESLTQRAAWHAFKAFASLRIITLIWILLFAALDDRTITEPDVLCKTESLVENNLDLDNFLRSALRWDSVCYLTIAERGYTAQPGLTGWPPVYPILIRTFAFVFQPPILAALIVSSLATWLALMLLYILIADNHNEVTAKNTLLLYVVFPSSFFLVSGYSEATYFVFVVACLLLAQRKQWAWAGIMGALAALTRNLGIFLSIALLWEGFLQFREKGSGKYTDLIKPFLVASMPVLGFGVFALYIHEVLKMGWPWQILSYYWGEYLGFPWQGIIGNAKRLSMVSTSADLYWLPTNLVDLIFAITIPITLAFHRHSIRASHMVYAWAVLLVSLIKLEPGDTLWAFSRYAITIFPFFVAVSPALQNRYVRLALVTVGLILQGALLYMFHIWSLAG